MQERGASVAEIGSGVFRIATFHEAWRRSINQYLISGEEPILISTGLRARFEDTWNGIRQVLDPTRIRSIVVPHFEADECGALNDFLERVPAATALASMRTVVASLTDFAIRPPHSLGDGEVLRSGTHDLRVMETPYVHAWDGITLADERARIAFTVDLFIQPGVSEAVTQDDRSALSVQLYRTFYGSPPEVYLQRALDRIEGAAPALLAPGHGSVLGGNLPAYFRAFRAFASELRTVRPTPDSTPAYR